MKHFIGVDLGGTNIKALCVSDDGTVLNCASLPTSDNADMNWAGRIRELIHELEQRQGAKASRIGLAAPGLASTDGRSIAIMPGRLQGLEKLDWTTFLKSPSPVSVLNDAHAALLGEVWQGAAKGLRNAVMLTLGTGVGGAIYADGRLLKGHIGRAGHLGHISLDADGTPDIVGTPGSLEDAIGECSLQHRGAGNFSSTRELVEAFKRGDESAKIIWLRSINKLACAIVSITNAVDPEVVIIGGGIAQAGPALFEPLNERLAKMEWRPAGHCVRIVSAKLGDQAGALGAAWNAIQQQESSK
jgi:glucokinase